MSVAMKCIERLVIANTIISESLDPLQFVYIYMLFIDTFSSVFNAIVSSKHITKLRTLGLNTSLCNWTLDFLTGRPPGGKSR